VSDELRRLTQLAGVDPGYHDIDGQWHPTDDATALALLRAMGLDPDDPAPWIARLEALQGEAAPPPSCVTPAELGVGRSFGVTCQIYALRSARNAGIGDLEDVAVLAEAVAAVGGDFLGLSPVHALFPEDPWRCSPYAPSSRRFLNELLIAIDTAAQDLDLPMPGIEGLDELRSAELIDYIAVASAKTAALHQLWASFVQRRPTDGIETAPAAAFHEWRAVQGIDLERFCRFQALALEVTRREGAPRYFRDWPEGWRSASDAGIHQLAEDKADEIGFRAFLQWLADRQLAAAKQRARAAGMRIGLYLDLAVGVVPDGGDAWADPDVLVKGASVGAPPDPLGPLGQTWGVVAPSPIVLEETDAAPSRAVIGAAMRHAGAVRIDHVLGLMRLFLIPEGGSAASGAYVRYPFLRLVRAIAEASRDTGCVVIGEDLGTVPDGFRPQIAEAGILGYRVLWFERAWPDPRFLPPGAWAAQVLAVVSTHDLPTVRGFLAARDLDWRGRLGHFPDPGRLQGERDARQRDVFLLDDRLREEGLLHGPADDDARTVGVHALLARTPSALVAIQLEDLIGEVEQANLPGTVHEHPNWRRRNAVDIEDALALPLAVRILDAVRAERPR